jgi:hypothetical protein
MHRICSWLRIAAMIAFVAGPVALAAQTYTYAGSWHVADGPVWTTNPQVMSGVETAAFLFGGSASDYAISTQGADPGTINFMAFVDGWGVTLDGAGVLVAQDFSATTNVDGGYNCGATACSYSAYVNDHLGNDVTNYAFRVSDTSTVPEPGSLALLGTGLVGLIPAIRRRR